MTYSQKVIWTPLPAGLNSSNGKLRLSVHVAPRLESTDSSTTTLDNWNDRKAWPSQIGSPAITFGVAFGDGTTSGWLPAVQAQIVSAAPRLDLWQGIFTGKKLGDYFNKTTEDWVNARRIINGLDKANLIAGHAKKFYGAISYTT